jgi:hypothetical protein
VKCSRERPSCTQCQKGGRSCKYLNSETPEFEFIQVKAPRKISKSPSPDNWMPVIERHFDTIKSMKAESPGRGGSQVPFWGGSASAQVRDEVQMCRPLTISDICTTDLQHTITRHNSHPTSACKELSQ